MKKSSAAIACLLVLCLSETAVAQDSPSGGPAKGNAPLKAPHTIDDGSSRPGANSFTERQARKHILNAGYTDVSMLTKGEDGVWRGTAMKGGASLSIALDYKGNVSERESSATAH